MDNENNDVLELLDTLYAMVTEAWGVPLGADKCIIERTKAVEIITDIKAKLPDSISQAKRIVTSRDEFLGTAKREAEAIRKTAEENAAQLVDSQEIVRAAKLKSEKMIADAEASSQAIRRKCCEYVNGILNDAEQRLSKAEAALTATRESFNRATAEKTPAAEESPAEE